MITRFKKILYVNETDAYQTSAMTRAVSLAKSNHANLTVVDVIPDEVISAAAGLPLNGPSAEELKAEVTANRLRNLATLIAPFKQDIDIRLQVTTGRRFLEVTRMVLSDAVDLVIKPSEKVGYRSVLAAVDIDPADSKPSAHDLNRTILELAGSIALLDHAVLHLAHAWDPSAEQTFLIQKGISGLIIGNTAEAVFQQLMCSILAVKPFGFKTPVK